MDRKIIIKFIKKRFLELSMPKKIKEGEKLEILSKIIGRIFGVIIGAGAIVRICGFFWKDNKLYPVLAFVFLGIIIWLSWLELRFRRIENDK